MRKRKNREVKCLACCHTARKQQRWGLDIGRLALKHLYELPLDSLVVQWSLCMLFRTNLAPDSHPNSQKDLSTQADLFQPLLVSPVAVLCSHPSLALLFPFPWPCCPSLQIRITPSLWKAGNRYPHPPLCVLPKQLSLCNVRREDTCQRFLESIQRSLWVGSSRLGPDHCSE